LLLTCTFLDRLALGFGMGVAAFIRSSIRMKLPPTPVRVPPTEVERR
jgi:hypothetical protein